MQKNKIMYGITAFIILINIIIPVYADDESEEASVTQEEIEEILEATTEASEIPTINSRNAIIYDRTSRYSDIWKRRKYKV